MIVQDGVILATHCAPASPMKNGIIVSTDMGKTWAQYDLAEFGPRSGTRFHEKNSEGWFRLDLRTGWVTQADVILGDSWLAPDGRLHVVWQKEPIHPKLRDLYFPDIKRNSHLCYAIVKDGKLVAKRTLFSGGETAGPLRPTGYIGHPRLHVTPDHQIYILCNLVGTTAETKAQTGNYALRIEADGSVSTPVRIPLARPIPGIFFTATPRAGNRLTEAADLLIADTIDGKPVARYARIRFCERT